MEDEDEYANPNPDDKEDTAAYELLRALRLRPLDLSSEHGFVDDYHLNWARRQIEIALAVKTALQSAGI